jgi:hypothetical protein
MRGGGIAERGAASLQPQSIRHWFEVLSGVKSIASNPGEACVNRLASPRSRSSPPSNRRSPRRVHLAPMAQRSGRGGLELLVQACATVDRVKALREAIDRDGEVVATRTGPKAHPALRDELAGRAFIVKTLERLGLNIETIKPGPGRPPKPLGRIPPT